MNAKRTPAEVLAESRRRDSRLKRAKVLETVEEMTGRGDPVTFAAVAKAARVSNWLVYAEGVREHIEAARGQQAARDRRSPSTGTGASTTGLKTDLALARQEITSLRTERDKLTDALRRQLGQQLDQAPSQDLITRISELTKQNQQLITERDTLERTNTALEGQLAEAEEDLAAARTSLRQMMRTGNSAPAT
ncbi:DUF6262 family protein [Streptomyces mirabilis]